jgi:hypothetical protein
LKTQRSFINTITMKIPVFDCAVPLCKVQKSLLVIRNMDWHNVRGLIFSRRRMSGLKYLQMSKQNEQKEREKIHTVRPAGLKPRRSFSNTTIAKISCF